jgi:hypothetical protein
VKRRDRHALLHVEAMRVGPLHAGVQVQDLAVGAPCPIDQLEQTGADSSAPFGGACDEVVDVELSDGRRGRDESPPSDADTPDIVAGRERSPLRAT